jgi:long-chain acyl-CoA synthetase
MSSAYTWSQDVLPGEFHGHPGLVYREHPKSITAVLTEARRWSDRPFIIHGARQVTFGEHEELVDAIAGNLHRAGVGPSDRVGLFAANTPEWVAAFFAILRLGAIVVPCNGWWSAEEMAHACQVTMPALVIADERRAERVPGTVTRVQLAGLAVTNPDAALAEPIEPFVDDFDDDAPAIILFTAGTTDFPKGATLSHRALVANLQTLLVVSRKLPHQIADDNKPSVALVGLPLFHIGAIQLILVPMMTGSEIVFLEGRFDAGEVLRLIESRGVTMFSGVPTMMERLLSDDHITRRDLASLRTVVLGGAPVDDALLARIQQAFPGTSRGVGRTYGLTEAGGVVSTGVGSEIRAHPGSSGRLAPVVEARIENADGTGSGEIFVRSPACMDGYWGMPSDTTISADGWIRTGDIGWVDEDRFLYVTGRAKDVIIRGGENIAAARVESVIREHPAVDEVAVMGLPDPDLGETVGAVIRLSAPGTTPDDLADFARQRLAHFAVPARWWFRDGPLPVNDAGKVLKRTLLDEWPGLRTIGQPINN